jgi:hypothetical protein
MNAPQHWTSAEWGRYLVFNRSFATTKVIRENLALHATFAHYAALAQSDQRNTQPKQGR